jgi:integrase
MSGQKQYPDQKETRRGHGEGSWLYLEDLDKWRFRVSAKTPDGITKRFAVTATTKTECRELAKARSEQIGKGIGLNIDTKNITVKDYLQRWVKDYVDPVLSDATKKVYRSMINNQLAGKISDIPLMKLQRPAIQRHFNELASGTESMATIALARVVLHAALKQACEDRIIGGNPATGVKIQQVVNKERIVYSQAEVQQILKVVADHRYRIAFHLLFGLALREGEALGLRWDNVDLKKGKAHIVEQLNRQKGAVYGPLKTKKSKRILPISSDLANELKAQKIRQKEELLKYGVAWKETLPVLSNEIGEPISHVMFFAEYRKVMETAGLKSTGVHDTRHTRLTMMGNSGMDAKTLSRFAGHAKTAFTLDKYVKESDDAATAVVNSLDSQIYEAK